MCNTVIINSMHRILFLSGIDELKTHHNFRSSARAVLNYESILRLSIYFDVLWQVHIYSMPAVALLFIHGLIHADTVGRQEVWYLVSIESVNKVIGKTPAVLLTWHFRGPFIMLITETNTNPQSVESISSYSSCTKARRGNVFVRLYVWPQCGATSKFETSDNYMQTHKLQNLTSRGETALDLEWFCVRHSYDRRQLQRWKNHEEIVKRVFSVVSSWRKFFSRCGSDAPGSVFQWGLHMCPVISVYLCCIMNGDHVILERRWSFRKFDRDTLMQRYRLTKRGILLDIYGRRYDFWAGTSIDDALDGSGCLSSVYIPNV